MLETKMTKEAKIMTDCDYPNCERCDKYIEHECTVPIVVSKQNFHELTLELAWLKKTLQEVENALYDEILGTKREPKDVLYEAVDCSCGIPEGYEL